jgi:hypothetical protein
LYLIAPGSYINGGCIVYSNSGEVVCARSLDYATILFGLGLSVLGIAIMVYGLKKYGIVNPSTEKQTAVNSKKNSR